MLWWLYSVPPTAAAASMYTLTKAHARSGFPDETESYFAAFPKWQNNAGGGRATISRK